MVAIGRALMLDPKLLLLDEPTAGLSPAFARLIFEKVVEINAGRGAHLDDRAKRQSRLGDVPPGVHPHHGTQPHGRPRRRPSRKPEVGRLFLGDDGVTEVLQVILYGLVLGSIIVLGAIGLTLTYGILNFANFAHGDMMTLGAYFALFYRFGLGWPLAPSRWWPR